MRLRVTRRKRKRTQESLRKGDEPPDPISLGTATLIAAGIGGATAIATPFINKALAPKAPKLNEGRQSILAGESTQLKPGERINAINTSPQGILSEASTGRKTLLGG